jgi:hypothetical protein
MGFNMFYMGQFLQAKSQLKCPRYVNCWIFFGTPLLWVSQLGPQRVVEPDQQTKRADSAPIAQGFDPIGTWRKNLRMFFGDESEPMTFHSYDGSMVLVY